MTTTWQESVKNFRDSIGEGYFSVKSLCEFILEEDWNSLDEMKDYLKDYSELTQQQLTFHSKWARLQHGNLSNIADYDRKEIAKVAELLDRLER